MTIKAQETVTDMGMDVEANLEDLAKSLGVPSRVFTGVSDGTTLSEVYEKQEDEQLKKRQEWWQKSIEDIAEKEMEGHTTQCKDRNGTGTIQVHSRVVKVYTRCQCVAKPKTKGYINFPNRKTIECNRCKKCLGSGTPELVASLGYVICNHCWGNFDVSKITLPQQNDQSFLKGLPPKHFNSTCCQLLEEKTELEKAIVQIDNSWGDKLDVNKTGALVKQSFNDGSFVSPSYIHPDRWVACEKNGLPLVQDDGKVKYHDTKGAAIESLQAKGLGPKKE